MCCLCYPWSSIDRETNWQSHKDGPSSDGAPECTTDTFPLPTTSDRLHASKQRPFAVIHRSARNRAARHDDLAYLPKVAIPRQLPRFRVQINLVHNIGDTLVMFPTRMSRAATVKDGEGYCRSTGWFAVPIRRGHLHCPRRSTTCCMRKARNSRCVKRKASFKGSRSLVVAAVASVALLLVDGWIRWDSISNDAQHWSCKIALPPYRRAVAALQYGFHFRRSSHDGECEECAYVHNV